MSYNSSRINILIMTLVTQKSRIILDKSLFIQSIEFI
jgi:hypothetical protein